MLHKLHSEELLLPTMLLKWFCVQASQWYRRQAASPAAIPAPLFEQVFDDIKNERPWAPNLSLPFLSALNLQHFHASTTTQPGLHATTTPGSTATQDTVTTGPGATTPPAPTNERTNNVNFNTALFNTYKVMPISCRSLRMKIARNELPALPTSKVDQNPMCLDWHVKGVCNAGCSRRANYVPYTTAEYQPLVQWCATNFHE